MTRARGPIGVAVPQRFARVLGGQALFPGAHALTALVGQAFVQVLDDEYLNVDVLWQVLGLRTQDVARRAVQVQMRRAAFRVMHPLHVLRSRLFNLHKLPEKQNERGLMQLRLAIDVGREYLRRFADEALARTAHVDVARLRGPVRAAAASHLTHPNPPAGTAPGPPASRSDRR